MAAMSRGREPKPYKITKSKRGTVSTNKHRFESFSQRIAKLNIDPVRRTRRTDLEQDVHNSSYFKTSLDEWRELNLSEHFTNFAREVQPLCESLPQIIHYEDRITDLLVAYIEGGDTVSLEPLLSLVSHYAHDLGVRFEKHFARIVSTVLRLAAKHPDVEVIEWTFTCLAWLFKYLSRQLVLDLRPLYDLMAPVLGKEHQKPFITRFAAESLSFLFRKASAMYHRNQVPLHTIVRHALEDLQRTEKEERVHLYQQGVMTLFSESMKGVQRGLHPSASSVFQELLSEAMAAFKVEPTSPEALPAVQVLEGVLISLIHHTDAYTFKPLLDVLTERLRGSLPNAEAKDIQFAARILRIVLGVRKGSRISDWTAIVDTTTRLVLCVDENNATPDIVTIREVLTTLAFVLQTCPLDVAVPHIRLLETITGDRWEISFLDFCVLFAGLGTERFESVLLPQLQRFITFHWERNSEKLCLLLPKLAICRSDGKQPFACPVPWHTEIVKAFQRLPQGVEEHETDGLYACNSYLEVMQLSVMQADQENQVNAILQTLLETAVTTRDLTAALPWTRFAVGKGFKYLAQKRGLTSIGFDLWPAICHASAAYGHMPAFWEATLDYFKTCAKELDNESPYMDVLAGALIDCLASPSHMLRTLGLDTLSAIYATRGHEAPEMLSIAILIESTPRNIETSRSISMRIRKLASGYRSIASDRWLSRAIPAYCFGLLYVKSSQIWEDACGALKEICEVKEGEEAVSRLAFDWLRGCSDSQHADSTDAGLAGQRKNLGQASSEFECTNLSRLLDIAQQSVLSTENIPLQLEALFNQQHESVNPLTLESRSQALRVLNGIPRVAEKRSRLLVPTLLQWTAEADSGVSQDTENGMEGAASALSTEQRWSRKDQKAMLALFAQFTNPKVLYKSSEVFKALLSLLANGDVEIQRSALKAIFAWSIPAINHYEEHLINLLDDARFREQVSVFLNFGQDDSSVQDQHRTELMPVMLRLLYGKLVNRAGSVSGRQGQEARRKAVFIALTRFGEHEFRLFLDIALGPLSRISLVRDSKLDEETLRQDAISTRKQHGLLNMLQDLLDTLRSQIVPFVGQLINPVLYCLVKAARSLSAAPATQPEDSTENMQTSLLKSVRQSGLRCLNMLVANRPEFDWATYMPIIMVELVEPRLEKLPIETAQSVSGTLRLFSTLSASLNTVSFLIKYNQNILDRVADCLEVASAKDEVKQFVLRDILERLIEIAGDGNAAELVLRQKANVFLVRVGAILHGSPGKDLLETSVRMVARLASFVGESFKDSEELINICVFLLQQPTKRVSPRTKHDLLEVLSHFLPRMATDSIDAMWRSSAYYAVSSQFGSLRDRPSRVLLGEVFALLADDHLQEIAQICRNLNSFSASRIDEPDFEKRNEAFRLINQTCSSFTITSWHPLVHNMLFYITDEEFSIGAGATESLCRFIEAAAKANESPDVSGLKTFKDLISTAIIPSIHKGVRRGAHESSELVRQEYLTVMGHIIRLFPTWSAVNDMHNLLAGGDAEASFFTNVLHIQAHRRLRALRRLAGEASAGNLSSGNISHFFLPLIEHFIFDKAEDESAHNLAAEAIRTVAVLAEWLNWPQYRALLRRYSKLDLDKLSIRLLGAVIDALSNAAKSKIHTPIADGTHASTLSKTMPNSEKLFDDLTNNLLPVLTSYIHQKDESEVSLRVPVAVAVVKILRILPEQEYVSRLPPLLLDVCQILRSKVQESRDLTRKTLAEIAALIGPQYFGFLLKELRSALQQGSQLHVLSYTVHSIMVSMTPYTKPGDLDYCIADLVAVIMDDIFGVTGQEKEAEDYTSRMKEVKSSKSYDSMELLAKTTTLKRLADLIGPIQALLLEKLDNRTVNKIDELLRRVGLGVLHNEAVRNREILMFCYEVIQEVYKFGSQPNASGKKEGYKTKRYLVVAKAVKDSRKTPASHMHKLTRFALDILRVVLRKHEELQTPRNLEGFVPIIGDAIVQGQEEVQISAIRLLSTIIKVPLAQIDKNAAVYVSEAVNIVRAAPSTNTELAQAALKMVSAVMRERREIDVKEKDLAFLLHKLKDDLEEPDRQGVTFNFLKAVVALVSRNPDIKLPELYEIMDSVARIMITNHTRTIRDLARSVYFQFLKECPQHKNRFSKQIEFLIKNLDYKHTEGRQSVMEALHLLLTKVKSDDLLQGIVRTAWLPLVLQMVNDDDSGCRERAGTLVKIAYEAADNERMGGFISQLRTWLDQEEKPLVRRMALQCYALFFSKASAISNGDRQLPDTDLNMYLANNNKAQEDEVAYVFGKLEFILDPSESWQDKEDWEIIFYALQTFAELCRLSLDRTFSAACAPMWEAVFRCMTFPHAWVKLSATRLVGRYLGDFARNTSDTELHRLPLEASSGFRLTGEEMLQIAHASLRALRVPAVSEELANRTAGNLLFLGRCFAANQIRWRQPNVNGDQEEPEDVQEVGEPDDVDMLAKKSALQHMFERLSAILRREPATTTAPALYAKTASLQLLKELCNAIPADTLTDSLSTILFPLHNLTDPTITAPNSNDPAFTAAHRALVDNSRDLMSQLQHKLGTTEYVRQLQVVKEGVRQRREGRIVKRRIEAVTMPEQFGREKRRRQEAKKEKSKERNAEARGRRRGW